MKKSILCKSFTSILLLTFLLFDVVAVPNQYNRKVINFNQDWLFEKDDWVGLNNASHLKWDDANWQSVQLPHSWNAEDTFDPLQGYYRGFGWYRKHFKLEEQHRGRTILIRFGAIGNQSDIWVNEQYFGKFSSGYTPIEIDITAALFFDRDNLIAVRVNNLHNDEIPPGRWRMDYNVYGGIYREVDLICLPPVHLLENEFFVKTPLVTKSECEISIQAKVKNSSGKPSDARIECQLFDQTKLISAFSQTIKVPRNLVRNYNGLSKIIPDVKLWSPEKPYLYTLKVTLFEGNQPVDELSTKIGFRKFYFDSEQGFFLNGTPLKLKGLNRHQCYPGLANAVPPRLQIEDVKILKELGANYVRCSHYPQHPDFLYACDSLGLLVYEELASWQHIGGDLFIENMNTMLEDMIRRDRNHPSVFLWGLMNEGRSVKMFSRLQKTAKELDDSRPTVYAENHLDVATEIGSAFITDILGLNYNLPTYDLLHTEFPFIKLINAECTNPDKSILGDFDSEIQGALKIKNDLDFLESRSFIAGSCIWSFHDYGSEYKPVWPVQTSGVVDGYRRFKEAAYYLKARWTEEPFIHIAGHWTFAGDIGKEKKVYIWHNCEKVQLYLNGKELKNNQVEKNLWKVIFEPGELKAVGKKAGKIVSFILRTAKNPKKIVLHLNYQTLKSDGYDAFPIIAEIVDSNGTIIPTNNKTIKFIISGGAKLVGIGGKTDIKTAGGSAAILIQSTGEQKDIIIQAENEDLESDKYIIRIND